MKPSGPYPLPWTHDLPCIRARRKDLSFISVLHTIAEVNNPCIQGSGGALSASVQVDSSLVFGSPPTRIPFLMNLDTLRENREATQCFYLGGSFPEKEPNL